MQKILSYTIAVNAKKVIDFLSNPYHLKQWTIHRHLYLLEGECYEASDIGGRTNFIKIEVIKTDEDEKERLRFLWTKAGNTIKFFDFEITAINIATAIIEIKLPKLPPTSKQERLERLLRIELTLLEKILNGYELSMKKEDALFMEHYLQQLKK
jgi:hypothetical protein